MGRIEIVIFLAASVPALGMEAGVPVGWQMNAVPADRSLESLGNEGLIDRLTDVEDSAANREPGARVDGFLPLDGMKASGRPSLGGPDPIVMAEIVRRGVGIIPVLLMHLSDRRPTRISCDPHPLESNADFGPFTDAYDSRFREDRAPPPGIHSGGRNSRRGTWPYAVKVGDLCFVALGQIVNRRLYVVGPDFGNGIVHLGAYELQINSPVESPALAEAARADWGAISGEDFAAQLEHDALTEDRQSNAESQSDGDWKPKIDRMGALVRLLFYYPVEGTRVAEGLLRRSLGAPGGASTRNGRPALSASDDDQAELLSGLDPFHWDSEDKALWDLFWAAAHEEKQRVAAHPDASAYSGSDLPRVCAERLIHRGHDGVLGAFFSEEAARMIREYPAAMARRKEEVTKDPSIYNATPGSRLADTEARRRQSRIDSTRTFLRQSIQARIDLLREIGIGGFEMPAD
jgi:hypothetical protein